MATGHNNIVVVRNELPITEPTGTTPALWVDNGVLKFWNGTESKQIDNTDANQFLTDAFGNIMIDNL